MISFLALLLLGASAATADTSPEGEKPKLTCHYEKTLDSRITRRKVCLTAEQRKQRDDEARESMSDLNKRHSPGNSSN